MKIVISSAVFCALFVFGFCASILYNRPRAEQPNLDIGSRVFLKQAIMAYTLETLEHAYLLSAKGNFEAVRFMIIDGECVFVTPHTEARIVGKSDQFLKVSTESGNEGWIRAADVLGGEALR